VVPFYSAAVGNFYSALDIRLPVRPLAGRPLYLGTFQDVFSRRSVCDV